MEPSRVWYQVNPPDPSSNFCAPFRKSTYALEHLRRPLHGNGDTRFQKAFGDSAYAVLTRGRTDRELDKQLVHPVAENFDLYT